MRFVIGRVEPQTLGINPNDMGPVMFDQMLHSMFQDLIRRPLAQREHMLGRVNLFLVDTATFYANGIYEEGNDMGRHFDFGAITLGGVVRR